MDIEKAISFLKNSVTRDSGFSPVFIANMDIVIRCVEGRLEDRWIPVNERLPNKSGYYLIQQDCSLHGYMRVAKFDKFQNKFRTAEVKCYYEDVKAWMPLPEPYKGE